MSLKYSSTIYQWFLEIYIEGLENKHCITDDSHAVFAAKLTVSKKKEISREEAKIICHDILNGSNFMRRYNQSVALGFDEDSKVEKTA